MAQAFVTATIAAAPVVVFSKITCPYCRLALSVLDAAVKGGRAGYTVVELGQRADGAAIQVRGRARGRGPPLRPLQRLGMLVPPRPCTRGERARGARRGRKSARKPPNA